MDDVELIPLRRHVVIIEKPQVYRAVSQRVTRTTSSRSHASWALSRARVSLRYKAELVLPAEWKVQLDKEICAARVLKALTPAERKIVDAVKCAKGLQPQHARCHRHRALEVGERGRLMGLVHITEPLWREKSDREKDDENHPCDYWWGRLCMCDGACSCHWVDDAIKGAEESMSTTAPTAITAAMVPVPAEAEAELVAEATKVAKAVVMLQAFEIKTSEDMELAGERVKIVKEWWNTIENRRTEMTQPINAGLRSINAFFKPLLDPLKNAEMTLKSKIAAYTLAVRAEQERAMQAAATAAAAGNTAAAAQHVAALAPQAPVQGVSVREVWDWEVVDEAAVPRQYLSIDPAKVKAVIETNPIYGLVPNIPGLRIFKKGSVTVRQK